VVAQQRPQDVDAAACQGGQDGLVVFLSFSSLAVVEGPRIPQCWMLISADMKKTRLSMRL
jgi:hypothetical protein